MLAFFFLVSHLLISASPDPTVKMKKDQQKLKAEPIVAAQMESDLKTSASECLLLRLIHSLYEDCEGGVLR